MYLPIWLLYWFPILLPLNYAVKWWLIRFEMWVFGKCTHCEAVCQTKPVLKSFLLTIAAELVGLTVFYMAEMKMNLSFEVYYAHYAQVCVPALSVTVILNCLLNYHLVFRKTVLSRGKRYLLTGINMVLTAPYLFLLPSGI